MKKLWKDVRKGDKVVLTVEHADVGRDDGVNGSGSWQFSGIMAYDYEPIFPYDPDAEVEVFHPYGPAFDKDNESLTEAVNACCTCGGGGPDDKHTCPACQVFHYLVSGVRRYSR